jgi:uncharacterized membrane protein
VTPRPVAGHPAIPERTDWPAVLGHNRTRPLPRGQVLVQVDGDPLVAVGAAGAGRVGVFTSDLAPHWAPPAFLKWEGYPQVWARLITWLAASR